MSVSGSFLETATGILMGIGYMMLGWTVGFAPLTDAEAKVDPRTLRWGRRPDNRHRLGYGIVAIGALLILIRLINIF